MKNVVDTINNLSSDFDEIAPYSSKHVIINVSWTDRPLFGELIEYDSRFLILRKKDGRSQTIRRKAVLCIEAQREMV